MAIGRPADSSRTTSSTSLRRSELHANERLQIMPGGGRRPGEPGRGASRQPPTANPPPARTAGLSMFIAWCMGGATTNHGFRVPKRLIKIRNARRAKRIKRTRPGGIWPTATWAGTYVQRTKPGPGHFPHLVFSRTSRVISLNEIFGGSRVKRWLNTPFGIRAVGRVARGGPCSTCWRRSSARP